MKDKIYKYLSVKDKKVNSHEIIEKFFFTAGNYPSQMESILNAVLKDDPRIIRDENGYWSVKKKQGEILINDILFSIIDFELIPIDSKNKIPFLFGLAQFQNNKIIKREIYSVRLPVEYSNQLKQIIKQRIENLKLHGDIADHVSELIQSIQNSILLVNASNSSLSNFNYLTRIFYGVEPELEVIYLNHLIRKILPQIKKITLENAAQCLSISHIENPDLESRLDLQFEIAAKIFEIISNEQITTKESLKTFLEKTDIWVDFSDFNFDKEFIQNLPETPCVYLMADKNDVVFYVGKAKNLNNRVSSYFVNKFDLDEKTKKMLDALHHIDIKQTGSELEALLLENRYIHEFNPRINTQIDVHPFKSENVLNKKQILFLPNIKQTHVALFLLKGNDFAQRIEIEISAEDYQEAEHAVANIFYHHAEIESDYNPDQIEIIWRWLSINSKHVNFIDVDEIGDLNHCIDTIIKYVNDQNLFLEKMHYR